MSIRQRYKSLDFLRGIAVLMVMFEHYEITKLFVHIGWSGVDLFFVLSGFFISGIIFNEYKLTNSFRPGRFLIRRGLKIWPLFYFVLLLNIVYFYFRGTPPLLKQVLAETFFIQNYIEGIIYVSWSLGVEEQFYIFMALCSFVIIYYKRIKLTVPLCLFLLAVSPILRLINYSIHPQFTLFTHHFPTYFRMDALACGILISYYFHFHHLTFIGYIKQYWHYLILGAILLSLPLLFFHISDFQMNTYGLTTTYLSYGCLLCLMISLLHNKPAEKIFSTPVISWIVWIGYYSYSIYLFHFSFGFGVANYFRKHLPDQTPKIFFDCIYLLSNIFIGYVSSALVERPILRRREKWIPSPVPTEKLRA